MMQKTFFPGKGIRPPCVTPNYTHFLGLDTHTPGRPFSL